ncbi:hypothetical protein PG994_000587 [Apiospora phragmitis]|uniref:Uncharacterized protein n=1 Tax=Apiospora phragmitis TaxID=2905665 RepID=A0ABR1X6Y3_9PEZI
MPPSSRAHAARQWPQVRTLAQFEQRFRELYMGACLRAWLLPEEQMWLYTVTEKFGTEITRDGLACWTASDLVEFLALTLPQPLKTDLYMASLLLQRCLLRLGSYLYLSRPTPGLTFGTLSVAVAILLQRYDESANPVIVRIRQRRTAAHRAHQLLLNCNHRYADAGPGNVIEFGPALVPAHELPSSRSADVAGAVHRDQFRSLLKLLLYCESPPFGLDADGVGPNADMRGLEGAARDVLARFQGPEGGVRGGVTWESFEMAFVYMAPRLMTGLGNLLSTFVLCPVDIDQMGRLSRDRLIAVIQQAMSAPINPMYNPY